MVRMQLGDLLVRAHLVTVEQVAKGLAAQENRGGRLGDHLVAMGALSAEALNEFLHRMPGEPGNLAATGIDPGELLTLLMKLIYAGRLESVRQFVDATRLPYHIVLDLVQMAVDRQLLRTLGTREEGSIAEMSYAFTEQGKRWAIDALQQGRYAGPAPVTLDEFCDRVSLQKITNEVISYKRIKEAIRDLSFDERIVEQAGPALNSGRAMLLYGPPGNGKTSVAQRFAGVFDDVIYIPYAVLVEGQIIRVFDPSLHVPIRPAQLKEMGKLNLLRQEAFDMRWVPCRRPFVIAGGELTLEMLDLRFNTVARYYEAPLHMKALGGCFLIDDFGRQLVSPTNLLNRWIVPLESRVDYLKLHTGKSFSIPFEELVIFSTNLDPEDLMDPAFLRRLPYKIEVGSPSLELFEEIFQRECQKQDVVLSDKILNLIIHKITEEKGLELAAYHPKFITDQVVATCRFTGQQPHFEPRFIDYAIDNLRVRQKSEAKVPVLVEAR
ncbi:MAG TPA: hypothetical protein VN517_18220 [Terriglobales bacterium]|nr:hypothetical protein [Terriglobales bacterium]